jgi:hypothetical protein
MKKAEHHEIGIYKLLRAARAKVWKEYLFFSGNINTDV